jgi:hypothetical protein
MGQLLTPVEVARLISMSVRFVREHASELGAIRLGGGKHRAGRLRFREESVWQFVASQDSDSARRPNETAPRKNTKRVA